MHRDSLVWPSNLDAAPDMGSLVSVGLWIDEERQYDQLLSNLHALGLAEAWDRVWRCLPLPLPIGVRCHQEHRREVVLRFPKLGIRPLLPVRTKPCGIASAGQDRYQ